MYVTVLLGLTWTSAISNFGVVSADWPKAEPNRNARKLIAAIARIIKLHH
jgi:hypothetical protein